jgi:hypothetical protein
LQAEQQINDGKAETTVVAWNYEEERGGPESRDPHYS